MNKKSHHYQNVESFMLRAGQECPVKPKTILSEETRLLRAKLIMEEALETIAGLGVTYIGFQYEDTMSIDLTIKDVDFKTNDNYDFLEVVDGCCDIMVVTTGTLVALGVPDLPVLEAVDLNNLAKFGPGGYRREDGKWIKPPSHTPPDLRSVIFS